MAFDSLSAFWMMEGHGPYVWTCYAAFVLLLGGLVWWSLRERRQLMANHRRQLLMERRDGGPVEEARVSRPAAASFQRINPS
ncbi:heme exporter protein CcmD [uncultured Marinobacter sp.]|uniref:heme exporter protein CcmD n=1 Tax=uncultured Marinobacter sp. TaxID=187379 RepID=UPI0030DA03B1